MGKVRYKPKALTGRSMIKPLLNGPGRFGYPWALFEGSSSHGVALGWKWTAPFGATDLADVLTGFYRGRKQLTHA
jgi:hypothetical protein